jgi:hypothetical protein
MNDYVCFSKTNTQKTHCPRRTSHSRQGHRDTFFRQILRFLAKRHIHLQTLRRKTVPLRKQIRIRLRLAKLRPRNPRRSKTATRRGWHAHGNPMCKLRRASGTRFFGRAFYGEEHSALRKLNFHGFRTRQRIVASCKQGFSMFSVFFSKNRR